MLVTYILQESNVDFTHLPGIGPLMRHPIGKSREQQ